jgi:uncharacterized protein (TIGR00251 family)
MALQYADMADDLFDVEARATVPATPARGDGAELDTILLRLHVQPGAGRASVAGRHGDALHVRVAPPPADNRANEACVDFLADLLDVSPAQVELVRGAKSREKRLRVRGVEVTTVRARLADALGRAGGSSRSAASRGPR